MKNIGPLSGLAQGNSCRFSTWALPQVAPDVAATSQRTSFGGAPRDGASRAGDVLKVAIFATRLSCWRSSSHISTSVYLCLENRTESSTSRGWTLPTMLGLVGTSFGLPMDFETAPSQSKESNGEERKGREGREGLYASCPQVRKPNIG